LGFKFRAFGEFRLPFIFNQIGYLGYLNFWVGVISNWELFILLIFKGKIFLGEPFRKNFTKEEDFRQTIF